MNHLPPSQHGFQLVPGDLAIIDHVHRYRFLTMEQLALLTERSYKKIQERVFKLVVHHYLSALRKVPTTKHLFSVGKEGLVLLVQHGLANDQVLWRRNRTNELTDFFLDHTLMVNQVRLALELASRASTTHLVDWKYEADIRDTVNNGAKTLPVWPDAFFSLKDTLRPDGKNRVHYFLECDRSTTRHIRFEQKFHSYLAYHEQAGHTKKHGIKTFRVLTVCLTQARARNLRDTAQKVLPAPVRKAYFFGSIEDASVASIFQPVFVTADDPETRYPLLRPLQPGFTQNESRDSMKRESLLHSV